MSIILWNSAAELKKALALAVSPEMSAACPAAVMIVAACSYASQAF
ncbi:hypothetical protein [Mycolicibacterium mucogenicum]|nr:hypothetical protein [Mycolicibacterium mucogenicum]